MALTKAFRDTVMARAQRDRAFRETLLSEAITHFLEGDLDAGKAMLRDYINATLGFAALAEGISIEVSTERNAA